MRYEIIVETNKIKTDDLKQIFKILKYLVNKDYKATFKALHISYIVENDIDLEMLKDMMEDDENGN